MSTIAERMTALLAELNWTNYRLAKEGDFSKTSITNWITGKNKPDKSKLEVIALVTGVNRDWLFEGIGEMTFTEPGKLGQETEEPAKRGRKRKNGGVPAQQEAGSAVTQVPYTEETEPVDLYLETKNGMKYFEKGPGKYVLRVPLVPYDAYARFANECDLNFDREEWETVDFEVDVIGRGNYMAFMVRGDSMDDGTKKGISQGEIVLVRELERPHWKDGLRYHKFPFWVISFDNSILIKQIVDQDLETGNIKCHSLNPSPEYRDFTVNLDDVNRIFNVLKVKIPDKTFK